MSNRRPAQELARRLADQERRIKALARKPQLANSSIENGKLEEYDADGNLTSIFGAQHDGTHGAITVNGPVPPVPAAPTVEVIPGVITVRWSGKFAGDETSPLDFKHVSVHVLPEGEPASPANQQATIRGELGDVATITAEPGTYFVSLMSWTTAGKFSAASETVEILVPDFIDTDALSQELADAREEIETTRTELDGRLITAEQDLADHEGRLATAEDELNTLENETLPALEADLATAKDTLDGIPAQIAESGQKIDEATDRLDTLENETLPGLSGQISSAQSRLTAAESTLAPLPGKISEAEADLVSAFGELATVDSRISTAKNSAISTAAADAQAKADAARADANAQIAQIIARGHNLVRNGNFEAGGDGWALNASSSITSANFRSGTRSLSVSNVGANNAWPTSEWVPSSTGRTYYLEYWVHEGGTPDNLKRIGAVAQIKRADGTTASNVFATIDSADVPNYEWVKISGTVTVNQDDIVGVRFAPWFEGPTASSYNVDDVLAVDVTEAQEALTAAANAQADATEALANAGTAQAAADAALTMAGSKSKVYYSHNGPSGTASPGDTWRRVDSRNNVIAEWRVTASGAWVSQEITTSMIANLDVGKLTAGSAEINSAVINKLAVGIATVIQLNADTITSGKLTSAQINTSDLAASIATIIQLNASRITAGTISADRLNIADLSARVATVIQLDASRITAGKINTARLNASEIAAAVATVIQLNASRITSGTINTARLNASEIAAATAAFQTVDVKNLFVSTGTMSEAVINKLWVDVVRSRKLTTDMLLVGTNGNLFPNGDGELGKVAGEWWATRLTADPTDKPDGITNSFKSTVGSGTIQGGYDFVEVTPGREYLFEIWVKASKPNSRIYIEMRDQNNAHAMTSTRPEGPGVLFWGNSAYPVNSAPVPTTWTKWSAVCVPKAGVERVRVAGLYFNHSSGTETGAQVWLAGLSLRPRVETSIIAAGAIMAPHLNVVSENPNGGRLEIMPNGLSVYGPEGGEPVTSITSDGGAVYSVTDPSTGDVLAAIDPDGGMTAQELSVSGESRLDGVVVINGDPLQDSHLGTDAPGEWGPVINGRSLLGTTFTNYVEEHPAVTNVHSWLTPLPHGVIANAWNDSSAGTNADGKWVWNGAGGENDYRMMLVSTQEFISGRMYSITYKTCAIRATDSGSGTLGAASLRVSSPGGSVSAGSGSALVGSRIYIPGDGTYFTPSYQGYFRCPEDIPAGRIMLGAEVYVYNGRTAESTGTADARRWEIAVADMGLRRPENNGDMVNLRKQGTATPPAPPAPKAPTPKQYTYTANATWWQAYKGDNAKATHSSYSGSAAQGRTPYATSNGTMRGLIGFPSLASKLSGATVKKIEVYVYAKHWHSSTGGTACLGVHGHGSTPTTWSASTNDVKRQKMKKPEGRWITLPSSVHAGFKSGSLRGISFYPPSGSTSTTYYGTFTGNKSRIRVTYVK